MPLRACRVLVILVAAFVLHGATDARAAGACVSFSGFPLNFNLGTGFNTGDGESLNCFAAKVQAAFAMIGKPSGIASLDGSGRMPGAQLPTVGSFASLALTTANSTGDVSGMTFTSNGGYPYQFAEQASDFVNVMEDIPASLRAGIRAGTNTTDLTAYIRNSLARATKEVFFPTGTYNICDSLPLASGQRIRGAGRVSTIISVGACFNMTAAAAINVAAGDGSEIDGIGITFVQPSAATTRAGLTHYPPAIEFSTATRLRIGTLRISAAWDGLHCAGNCGGFIADTIEIGAFDKGILLDGLQDFAHVTTLNCWPYGITNNSRWNSIYADLTTACAEFGRVDGLDVKTLNTYTASVSGNVNGNTGAARQIGLMQLDGDGARFKSFAGDFQIGMLSSTKGVVNDTTPAIWNAGGTMVIGSIRAWGAQSNAYINASAGTLVINGGSIEQTADAPAVQVTGGTAIINDVRLSPGQGSTRTQPYLLAQTGGCLIAKNNTATTTGSGNLAFITTDAACETIQGNDFNGWGYALPSGAKLGEYGPNKVAPFTWTPVPSFDGGNGTFAVSSYAVQQGFYSYGAGKVDYWFRVYFTHGAFSGATGNFAVTGLPFLSATMDVYPGTLGEFSNFTLSSGYTGAFPYVSAGTSNTGIHLMQQGGPSPTQLPSTGVSTASGTQYLSATGSVPLR